MSSIHFSEYSINDKIYIDIKEVRSNCKHYCKGTRSIAQLVDRKGFRDVVYGQIRDGVVEITPTMSRQRGTAFINKDELAELFVVEANAPVVPPAPPIITDQDLTFFKDGEGQEYNVQMRGERTRKGIYFKVKDVQRVFEMDRLVNIVQYEHTGYHAQLHYQWFIVSNDNIVDKQHDDPVHNRQDARQDARRELYLTYKGLMRVIYRSNSGIASEFQEWIDECVFVMNWGTQEQKIKVVSKVLNADADHLKAIMSSYPTAITCLYLIDIGIDDNGKRVFKYGFSKDIERRFKEHVKTYGVDIKLDTFILIPELDLSKAEATFRQSISTYQYTAIQDKDELISLCDEAYKNVQMIFTTITQMYCGNFKAQIAYYDAKIKKLEFHLELKDEQCARKLAEKDIQLVGAQKDTEIYQLRIQLLEMQLAQLQTLG